MNRTTGDHGSIRTVGAVETAFTITDALRTHAPVGVSALAAELDMPRSTVYVHLTTLEQAGFVVRDGEQYRLGLEFLRYGSSARNSCNVYRAAKGEVEQLAEETGEAGNLGVEQGGQRVILYKHEVGEAIYDNTPTGEFTLMHWTAIGKAILAYRPREEVEAIVDRHGLPRSTPNTVTDSEQLFNELDTIVNDGYSIEDEERREGVVAIAAPIRNTDTGHAVGALSISGPRHRLKRDGNLNPAFIDAVRNHANVAELRYNHY
ncbi:IclR family transcriptional regulator [Natronobiforma cellulositropha]|uniref:IclR family transcriptional regulator n=1 Tax=Natronobiforma cellulositropha TaxID=1679076 RepID=UPI0021D5B4F5|nr:IclR family transcriptional regulator [Natronobiforma cellulositropha]